MRRKGVVVACLLMAPVLVAVTGCTSSDAPPAPAAPASVSKQAGVQSSGGGASGLIASALLESLLKPGVESGYEFLGDVLSGEDTKGSEADLAKIDEQLGTMSGQLTDISTRLTTLTAELEGAELRREVERMEGYRNRILPVFNTSLRNVANAAKTLTAHKAMVAAGKTVDDSDPKNPVTIDIANDMKNLGDMKTAFERDFSNAEVRATMLNQHEALYPRGTNEWSILKYAGRSMQNDGYLTSMSSKQLKDMYLAYADQEALSATLILEYDRMFIQDANARNDKITQDANAYTGYREQEVANLPPEIPEGQILVMGSPLNGDVEQMYMVPGDRDVNVTWPPMTQEKAQLLSNAPSDIAAQHPGWSLPTDPGLNNLYEATKKATAPPSGPNTGATRLGYMWEKGDAPNAQYLSSLWNRDWFWTSNINESTQMQCEKTFAYNSSGRSTRSYWVHSAGRFDWADKIGLSPRPTEIPKDSIYFTNNECDMAIATTYNKPEWAASVVLTRVVDPAVDDFAAQTDKTKSP